MAKIGIYGGTFNPPHLGHVLAARAAKEALGLDRVLLVPDAQPPHKALPEGSPTPRQRVELTRLAAQDEPWLEVSEIELDRPGKSYTSDTLRVLSQRYPGDTLYLLMGTDMFLSLHTWHEPEVICRLAVIVGMNRETDPTGAMEQQKALLEDRFGAAVTVLGNVPLEISSTHLRRMLILGGADHYMDPKVLSYIRENGLYGTGRDYRNLPMEELKNVVVSLLKPKRVNHVLGCAETAVRLAEQYGADPVLARRAGLLHDITKAMDGPDQLLLLDRYDIIVSDFERNHPKLLHAKTGAGVAKCVFGECEEVCRAIYWHTTGKPDMRLMEKIVYIADYMEPNRSFPGVEDLRKVVFQDLDRGLLMGFEMCIDELVRENKTVCQDSVDARDYLRRQLMAAES